jgi:arginyl-tRNA synthetase
MSTEDAWIAGLRDAARRLWGLEIPPPVLEPPSDPKFGDATSSAPMRLARDLRKPPRAIAEELARAVQGAGLPGLAKAEVAGAGYVNLTAVPEFHHEELSRILSEGADYGRSRAGGGRKVLVEHCSANPTGPLHIAHGRQAAVGDSLANILDFAGFRVAREFYVNDTGNQIDMLGKSILWRLSDNPNPPDENCYRGDYIRALAEELSAQGGAIDLDRARRHGVERLLAEIQRDLETFRVRYDAWQSEEALHRSGKVDEALNFFTSWGLTYQKEGATYLRTADHGDVEDKPIVKADGSFVYRLPDLAYHRDKFERGFEILIDLWGPDHHAHIATMKAGLKALNYDLVPVDRVRPAAGAPQEQRPVAFEVLLIQHCRLLEGGVEVKMSKRAASYVTLRELMEEVGVDATRFFFAMRKPSSHLDFDLDVAKKQNKDNPYYYAGYAHARVSNINVKGVEEKKVDPADLKDGVWRGAYDPAKLGPDEIALLKVARQFRRRVEIAARDLDPAAVAEYLRELSGAYQAYYELGNRDSAKRVLSDDEPVRRARLAVSAAVQQVLRNGFRLLGLSAPDRM